MTSASPRQNRNGTISWRVQFRIGGRVCQETFADDQAANEFAALVDRVGGSAARKVLEARNTAGVGMPTLREWTATYLDAASGHLTGVEPGTRANYAREAERSFLNVLGDLPLNAITKSDVGRWVAWQEEQPSKRFEGRLVAPKTMRNYANLLSQMLFAAVEAQIIPTNPANRTRVSKGARREGVFLTRDEFTTLLHFIPQKWERLVMFLAGSGCRWGEATALTWGDFNLNVSPATVRITKAWKKSTNGAPVLKHPKTSRSRRTISIPDDVIGALGKAGASDELVFKNSAGTHLWPGSFHTRVWQPAVRAASDPELCEQEGLTPLRRRPTIHDLRHGHASWLIAAGTNLMDVQARLGHENIDTTVGVYGHLAPDAHGRMSDTIANVLQGVRPLRVIES